MPRIARVVATGYPHHITQRGNYQQKIFSSDADRQKYLSFLESESKRYGLKILAYCLMPNHLHLIAVPRSEDSLGKAFKYISMKYSQYCNKKTRTAGHLFQGRFFSAVMDKYHTVACARYIERNPVRAKMVQRPCDWEWSSAKTHCGVKKHDTLGVKSLFDYVDSCQRDWQTFILEPDDPEQMKKIREQTGRGRPLGEDRFIKRLEEKLERILILKPRGRPKKNRK